MAHRRLTAATALALALAVPAIPAAQAHPDRPMSAAATALGAVDLRSPDARDAARPAPAGQDLRAPDQREVAAPAALLTTAMPHPVKADNSDDDLEIVAGGAAASLALALVAVLGVRRRGRSLATPS